MRLLVLTGTTLQCRNKDQLILNEFRHSQTGFEEERNKTKRVSFRLFSYSSFAIKVSPSTSEKG